METLFSSNAAPSPGAESNNKGCLGCLGFLVLIVLVIAAGRVFWPSAFIDPKAAERDAAIARDPRIGNEGRVCIAMQHYAQDLLRSPSTADFPSCAWGAQSHTVYLGNGHYQMRSWVDAQNGFGATVRQYFTADVDVDRNRALTIRNFSW